jgi:hypothetical protein
MKHLCAQLIYWYETSHHTACQLPAAHPGDHCDGLYWWDNNGIRTPHATPAREHYWTRKRAA